MSENERSPTDQIDWLIHKVDRGSSLTGGDVRLLVNEVKSLRSNALCCPECGTVVVRCDEAGEIALNEIANMLADDKVKTWAKEVFGNKEEVRGE